MLSAAFAALLSCPFLMLRLGTTAGSFPKPLTASEERHYVQLSAAGDENARSVLIEHNLRLVAHIIKKYYTQTDDQDDLISIGTIGLIKGVSTYQPDKGVRLATYASRCIENEVLMYFRSMRKSANDLSLSDTIEDNREGDSLSLMDVISADGDMLEDITAGETYARVRRYVRESLTKREAEIITMRYGLDGRPPRTQREIAARCGISRSYVSRIEKKAIDTLRECFERDG